MNTPRRLACLTSTPTLLLALALLAGTSHAALPTASAGSLAMNLHFGVATVLAGPIVVAGPGVIVPAAPTPRSPFQPPKWLPSTPPWIKPAPAAPVALRRIR